MLDDVRLRRAVAASIDTESFVEGFLDGNAEQVNTVSPPAVLGEFADMVKGVPFDKDVALAALGFFGLGAQPPTP